MNFLHLPSKKIRADVIKRYIEGKRYSGVVCFSCGNASRELKDAGLNVIDISPSGDFIPARWFHPSEIAELFPYYFDATSGHLSMELMALLAGSFKSYLGDIEDYCNVATGSGETIICLKMAYPKKHFTAVYNIDKATEYSEFAVLNPLVKAIADNIIFKNNGNKGKGVDSGQL